MSNNECEASFKLFFNRRKQWVCVYLEDVHPETFKRNGGGRWGYYLQNGERGRAGLFGEIHLVRSRVRSDGVSHELIHLLADYLRARGTAITVYNEERIAELFDNWTRQFWREYGKIK